MRFAIVFALLFGVTCASSAQDITPASAVRVHKLAIVSNDLPANERQSIVQAFQGRTDNLDVLTERVRQKLRDTGYAEASVEFAKGKLAPGGRSTCSADVTFAVEAGERYRLGEIAFEGAKVFPPEQLRSLFPASGTLFNATAIGKGLENLKELYDTAGYPNFGAIPKPVYDRERHILSLTIDQDPGAAFSFGKLLFEGIEPRAGIANALLAAWDLKGKRYNPQLVKEWLAANTESLPREWRDQIHFDGVQDPDRHIANVLLHFQ